MLTAVAPGSAADFEARTLVRAVVGDRWWARLGEVADEGELKVFRDMLDRRLDHEPLPYILGEWDFGELTLQVERGVLIPRPETEIVVEFVLSELAKLGRESDTPPQVVDLGTGSGAIALGVAAGDPTVHCVATELSEPAAAVAEANFARYPGLAARIRLRRGSWFRALPPELLAGVDVLVSNPPYVSEAEMEGLPPEVAVWEPREALTPGPSGMEAVESLLGEAPEWLRRPGVFIMEIASERAAECVSVALASGAQAAEVAPDLQGRPRVLVARW